MSRASRRRTAVCARALLLLALALAPQSAWAQGGPPLVTDDPETPGDGHWEVNLAATGSYNPQRWDIALPDADINYGWGEHVQLKLDVPWTLVRESGQHWQSGLGSSEVGVKWRFVDAEDAGFSMSTYPQYSWNWLASSASRGITNSARQFFLPVEAAAVVGGYGLDAEVGRNFVVEAPDRPSQWVAGFILAHAWGAEVECMGEVHETVAPHNAQTLINLGMHWKFNESLYLLASVGRQFGPRSEDQQRGVFYLGVQILR